MRSAHATRSQHSQSQGYDDWAGTEWHEPARPKRDWKKALLVLGLGTLSWVATYVGMLELIQANMGELSFSHKVIIGFSVAMLMTMIIWLLDQMFAPLPLVTKLAYVTGYLFLTLISVGFGFGFYWKVLESRSEASRSAESAVTQVKTALYGASARLDQLQTTLDQLTEISTAKAVEERERGTTCPNSRPGDGPRRRLRDADAARFSFASQFVKGRAAKSKAEMASLDVDMKKITSADPSTFDPKTGTRNAFLQALTRRLELTATGFNAFRTDPQLRQIRAELAERASKTEFPTSSGGTFACPDPQLQSALRGVVRAIDQLPELGKPQIATVEGAQAVVEAFRRLTTTLFGVLTFKLPPSADELRALQQKAVQSVENAAARQAQIKVGEGGLSKRDYIPLAIALFVDLCLLLVSIGRPMNRLHGLIPKMREAERGPVYQILSRFDDIHRDRKIREKFEVFRHVVFDFNGDYYVAVPLDAPRNRNPEEVNNLQQEAHLLANLFASFEKEKIFSRVHNPLLTRKTIQKKLWRQGSKFAESQAFRTYRFRDGAWSEIILGAVMGASRDAGRMQEAARRAHELPLGASFEPASEPVSQAAEVQSAEAVRRSLDERLRQASETVWPGIAGRTVDPELSEKYGPYAASMATATEAAPGELPQQPASLRWPYRKPEPPPGEAEVEFHIAANSNTSPGQRAGDHDNVIHMPIPRAAQPDHVEGHWQFNPAPALDGALPRLPAAVQQHEAQLQPIIELPDASAQLHPNVAAGVEMQPPRAAAQPAEQLINVQLRERTAEFTVPVTDAQVPQRILQAMGQSDATQLTMDLAPAAAPPPQASLLSHDEQVAEAITEQLEAPMDLEPEGVDEVEVVDEITLDDGKDDPFMRVAHRFAAKQGPAE